jgi:Zn-dependent protease with chaperone function
VESLGRSLMLLGIALLVVGAFLYLGGGIPWLGRLPGDLRIERPGVRIDLPITSCILVSVVLSLLSFLWSRLRG